MGVEVGSKQTSDRPLIRNASRLSSRNMVAFFTYSLRGAYTGPGSHIARFLKLKLDRYGTKNAFQSASLVNARQFTPFWKDSQLHRHLLGWVYRKKSSSNPSSRRGHLSYHLVRLRAAPSWSGFATILTLAVMKLRDCTSSSLAMLGRSK